MNHVKRTLKAIAAFARAFDENRVIEGREQVRPLLYHSFVAAFVALALSGAAQAAEPLPTAIGQTRQAAEPPSSAELERAFAERPAEYRPWVYLYFCMSPYNTDGLPKDIEAMRQGGLGGARFYSLNSFPDFGTPEWKEGILTLFGGAKKNGLKIGMQNCGGWSHTGGYAITPELSMKEFSATTVNAEGGKPFHGILPHPDTGKTPFYRDIAVLAYPVHQTRWIFNSAPELQALCDGDLETRLPVSALHDATLDMGEERILRSLVFRGMWNSEPAPGNTEGVVECSLDGKTFALCANFGFGRYSPADAASMTIALPETKTRYVRIRFKGPTHSTLIRNQVGEVELSSVPVVHYREIKAGLINGQAYGYEGRFLEHFSGPVPDEKQTLDPKSIMDLTSMMQPDGNLAWTPPGTSAHWRILRIGYRSTGKINGGGRGLQGYEADKLDRNAMRIHLESYVGKTIDMLPPEIRSVVESVHADSWEAGSFQWSSGLEKIFKNKMGYDIVPWLPLIWDGVVIGSVADSERVLYDWRNFLTDQLAEEGYGELARFAKDRGLQLTGQPFGAGQFLSAFQYALPFDLVQGEVWGKSQIKRDVRMASSVANLYGKIAGSETFTGAELDATPANLKPHLDEQFAAGLSSYTFHTYGHQAYETRGPGFNAWQGFFYRKNTWWPYFNHFTDYMARCSALLRPGHRVADLLFLHTDDTLLNMVYSWQMTPNQPERYGMDFDRCDGKTLLLAKVRDGRIFFPSGAEYRVLVLPQRRLLLRLETLRQIKNLIEAGATVALGPKPESDPSYRSTLADPSAYAVVCKEIWEKALGERVFNNSDSVLELAKRAQLIPDVSVPGQKNPLPLIFTHRRIGGVDVYFLAASKPFAGKLALRTSGRIPELWDAVSGGRQPVRQFEQDAQITTLSLELAAGQSVLVVFRTPSNPDILRQALQYPTTPQPSETKEVEGSWEVSFEPDLGAPPKATFEKLVSYLDRPEQGIRDFSGKATYRRTIEIPAAMLKGKRLYIDLGQVESLAEVKLNGKSAGVAWCEPMRVDISAIAMAGKNQLEIDVVNTWDNLVLAEIKKHGKKAFGLGIDAFGGNRDWLGKEPVPPGRTIFGFNLMGGGGPTKPIPAGLIGPVKLQSEE